MHTLFNYKHNKSFDGIYEAIINEGHFASYSIDKLFNHLKKTFNDIEIDYTNELENLTNTKYGIVGSFVLHIAYPTKDTESILNHILQLYGYYISTKNITSSLFEALIEPRVPQDITTVLTNITNTLYHITHESNIKKIEKIGLAPRETETSFLHPEDRIYLVYADLTVVSSLVKILAKNKRLPPNEFVVIKVKIDPSFKFFIDDTTTQQKGNLQYIGCFTTKNIPPELIEIQRNNL